MRGIKKINTALEMTFGVKVKKTRWKTSKKPEWPSASSPVGMVDYFGRKYITGWVSAPYIDYPIKVTLNINGVPVHGTWANVKSTLNTPDKVQSFYIGTKEIWDYCKKKDRLTVRVGDTILPIANKGTYKKPRDDGAQSLEDLKEKLSNKYVFNRGGHLQLSKKLDTAWQKKVIRLYNRTSKALKKYANITPFLIYGSLLGQVREGTFIGHDDDFDIAFISKHNDGHGAAMELVDIARFLKEEGFAIELKGTAIHIHDELEPDIRIDLFHLFFNKNKELSFPFGIAGTSTFMKTDWNGTTKNQFAGFPVTIPKNAEKLVEHIYGESWQTPIAGFNWNHARTKRDESGIIPLDTRDDINIESKSYGI